MLPVVTDVSELYKTADCGAMATLIAKLAIEKSYSSKLEETRNAIQVRMLAPRSNQPKSSIAIACLRLVQ